MAMKSRKYFLNLDFIIVIFFIIFSVIVMGIYVFFVVKNEEYNTMRYDLISLSKIAVIYDFQNIMNDEEIITFEDLKNEEYYKPIINPFNNKGICDEKNSHIVKRNNDIYITLNCGNYWIIDYKINSKDTIKIYKIINNNKKLLKQFE